MPTPKTKTVHQEQQYSFVVPADSCRLNFGYKDRNSTVFEWRGDHLYLCDDRDDRFPNRIIAANVPFEVFAEHWPRIIEFFQAKAAVARGGSKSDEQ